MAGYNLWFELKNERPELDIDDFNEGQVVMMQPGYHTNNSYYVQVLNVSKWIFTSMTVGIPGQHSLHIKYGGELWNYHVGRMMIVGDISTHGHLLLNQALD